MLPTLSANLLGLAASAAVAGAYLAIPNTMAHIAPANHVAATTFGACTATMFAALTGRSLRLTSLWARRANEISTRHPRAYTLAKSDAVPLEALPPEGRAYLHAVHRKEVHNVLSGLGFVGASLGFLSSAVPKSLYWMWALVNP